MRASTNSTLTSGAPILKSWVVVRYRDPDPTQDASRFEGGGSQTVPLGRAAFTDENQAGADDTYK
eukprot:5043654-Pyramimonas_sp.AAC.5